MECSSCNPTPVRKDRAHTFFMHEMSNCPTCSNLVEARVVLRDDQVFHLKHCAQCGPSEALISTDANAYVKAFLARGEGEEDISGNRLLKHTTSTCPGCLS